MVPLLMPVKMALHDQQCHVVPHFDNLDLRNAVVSLIMLSMSCDAGTGANGFT